MSVRDKFVARFGEDEAGKLEAAAEEHKNGVHDNAGSDHFRWVIAICIGYECASKESFREYHGITVPWEELQKWIVMEGDLENHDGDVDYISLLAGSYSEFVLMDKQ